jgi:hypothetical protein
MTNLKVLGVVVIAASTLSSPVLAQTALTNPDAYEDEFGNNPNIGTGGPNTNGYRYRHSDRRTVYRQPAMGAAAGAAAVATAPFGGWSNSYAQYGGGDYGWRGDWNSYAARNGIVCKPGTYFKGADGLRQLCQ